MASGSASRVEGQPPALPAKQHRRNSLRCSNLESDCVTLSPVGLQHQNYTYNDVFSEPTDCHADQCPIHQRYDPSHHLERFFSDGLPPPIPKKRLARALSLPGISVPLLSPLPPLSPLPRHPQSFDNPLYMLSPIPGTYFHKETEEIKATTISEVPLLPFSQLSFDTPDEHLPYLFSSFDDQSVVSQGIQHRHLLFLRSMAQSVEADIVLQREASDKDFNSYQPQDFLLCEDSEPKQIGDTVYYSLHSPKFPGRVLGLKVHKRTDEAPSAHSKYHSSHVNVKDVIVHFQPSNTMRDDSVTLCNQDPSSPPMSDCTAPCDGSRVSAKDPADTSRSSVQSFLQKGHAVSIERDIPYGTLKEFVHGNSSLQSTECLSYDRQLCVVFLQILIGSQHLYNTDATAAELRPQDILLVWPRREKDKGDDKLEQDASRRQRVLRMNRVKDELEWEKTERKGGVQMLWRTRGSARVVLTPQSSALPAPDTLPAIKSQIGALIRYCLHLQEDASSLGSSPVQFKSSYRTGLLYLSSLLQNESTKHQMADIVAMLQVLLWGPRIPLYNHSGSTTTTAHNWLTIKRALLVMKLAERGLIQDQSVLDWEDCMCLQYLSFTDPETLVSVTSQLWINLKVN